MDESSTSFEDVNDPDFSRSSTPTEIEKPKNVIIFQQTGVYLHYLPGREDEQTLVDGKLEIIDNSGCPNPMKSSDVCVRWSPSDTQYVNSPQSSDRITKNTENTKNTDSTTNTTNTTSTTNATKTQKSVTNTEKSSISSSFHSAKSQKPQNSRNRNNSSSNTDWTMVGEQKNAQSSAQSSKFSLNLKHLAKIRKNPPSVNWQYCVLVLKDNVQLPAFHFHSGGFESFISTLRHFAVLTESPRDRLTFTVTLNQNDLLDRSLDELHLFQKDNRSVRNNVRQGVKEMFKEENVSWFLKDPVRGVLGGISKLGGVVHDTLDQSSKPRATRPREIKASYSVDEKKNGFDDDTYFVNSASEMSPECDFIQENDFIKPLKEETYRAF